MSRYERRDNDFFAYYLVKNDDIDNLKRLLEKDPEQAFAKVFRIPKKPQKCIGASAQFSGDEDSDFEEEEEEDANFTDINEWKPCKTNAPSVIMYAACNGRLEALDLLIHHGRCPDYWEESELPHSPYRVTSDRPNNPMSACLDHADIVEMLMRKHGANPNIGATAISHEGLQGIQGTMSSSEAYCSMHYEDRFVQLHELDLTPACISWTILDNRKTLCPRPPAHIFETVLHAIITEGTYENEQYKLADSLIGKLHEELARQVYRTHRFYLDVEWEFPKLLEALLYCINTRLHDNKISALKALAVLIIIKDEIPSFEVELELVVPHIQEILSLLHTERGYVCAVILDFACLLLKEDIFEVSDAVVTFPNLVRLANAHSRSKLSCVRRSAERFLYKLSKMNIFRDAIADLELDRSHAAEMDKIKQQELEEWQHDCIVPNEQAKKSALQALKTRHYAKLNELLHDGMNIAKMTIMERLPQDEAIPELLDSILGLLGHGTRECRVLVIDYLFALSKTKEHCVYFPIHRLAEHFGKQFILYNPTIRYTFAATVCNVLDTLTRCEEFVTCVEAVRGLWKMVGTSDIAGVIAATATLANITRHVDSIGHSVLALPVAQAISTPTEISALIELSAEPCYATYDPHLLQYLMITLHRLESSLRVTHPDVVHWITNLRTMYQGQHFHDFCVQDHSHEHYSLGPIVLTSFYQLPSDDVDDYSLL